MHVGKQAATTAVYFIADHLDAILAAGEDLRKLSIEIDPVTGGHNLEDFHELRQFVEDIQALELTIIARTLEARKRAADIHNADKVLRMILGLFTGGTSALSDAAVECGDPCLAEFNTAGDALDYLRSRCLIDDQIGSLKTTNGIEVTEDLHIAARVPLGTIMDHAAAVLDALDAFFDLYSSDSNADSDKAAGRTPVDWAGGTPTFIPPLG